MSPALSCHLGVQSSLFAAHLRRNIRYTSYSRVLHLPGGYDVELFNTTPVIITAAKHRPDQPPGSAARDSETSPPLTTRIMTRGHRTQDSEASSGPLTASPSRQNFVCLVRSRLRCHVRRHRHARNKGKFGSYAFLHATPSDYIRSHCTSYFTL